MGNKSAKSRKNTVNLDNLPGQTQEFSRPSTDKIFHPQVEKFFKEWKEQKHVEFQELLSGTISTNNMSDRFSDRSSNWLSEFKEKISLNQDLKNRDDYLKFIDLLKRLSRDTEQRYFKEYVGSINLDKNLRLLSKLDNKSFDEKAIKKKLKSSRSDNIHLSSTNNILSTGFNSSLQLDLQQLQLLKHQLELNDHPIKRIINFIRGIFILQYRNLLLNNISECDLMAEDKNITESLKFFIKTISEAISKFYLLDLYETSQLWKEVLQVMVTQLLIQKDLYALIINLITLSHQKEIDALHHLMNSKTLKLSDIKIDKKFQLNIHDREQNLVCIDDVGSGRENNLVVQEEEQDSVFQPYQRTIKLIKQIKFQQSIPQKLEIAYEALKIQLGQDIDDFWNGYKLKQNQSYRASQKASMKEKYFQQLSERVSQTQALLNQRNSPKQSNHVDFEKLQQLALYVVWASNCPEIYSDCLFIKRFNNQTLNHSMRGFFARLLDACVNVMLNSGSNIGSTEEIDDQQVLELSVQDIENLQNSLLQKERLMPLFDINFMTQTLLPSFQKNQTSVSTKNRLSKRRDSITSLMTQANSPDQQLEIALEFEKLIFCQAQFIYESESRQVSRNLEEQKYTMLQKKTTVLCSSDESFISTVKNLRNKLVENQIPVVQQVYNFTGSSFAEVEDNGNEGKNSLQGMRINIDNVDFDDQYRNSLPTQ
ncbi:UNKNOWN [Stylonychia lemnae]|uniref:VPS9 domain-containing protein n=1 Tax=Stylonychia lemnae TaxID=5949 RepID=A0A078BAQ7_STYLE|nr:UNKNOWN [Stylonychia lemnae]|eukprot:CDW91306.1 UNKNOWN [Stylonychia lemnae]